MSLTHLRREIYLLLSEAYKQPTEAFVAEQESLVRFLRQALQELNYNLPREFYENWPALLPDLPTAHAAYRQSFLFPASSRVVPVESIYRRWTTDASAEVPFAAEKGLLLSDHALHMKTLYETFGITLPAEYEPMPDHLCLELEFAALLLEHNDESKYGLFIAEHLNWLDELVADADQQNIPDYYRQLIKLTAQFLTLELRRYEQ
jgi:TorA maturation chaperone TorD